MSNIESEVKAAVAAEKAALESRVAQLEAQAKTWYERHVPLIVGVLAFLVGWTVGHVHL